MDVEYEDWHAYHDHMTKQLHVTGTCIVEGGGFAASLEPAQSGFNPKMVMLTLRFTPTGESPSRQPVEFREGWPEELEPTEVGFRTEGPDAPAPPSQLTIEDVY